MKHLLTIIIALLCLNASAQDTIPKINGQYEYQQVVKIDTGTSKDELFKKAKLYFVDNFKSANDVIQYQDATEGRIVGKGYYSIVESDWIVPLEWQVSYTTEIMCKNGKYRYRFYDISIKQIRANAANQIKYLTVEQAYLQTTKGSLKKPSRLLISDMVKTFTASIKILEASMVKNISFANSSDF